MGTNLVIVESPAKAKTIKKFLGEDFIVKSSNGHIRDLSKKNNGIDIEKGFIPEYVIPVEKRKIVAELKQNASEVETIWLASDEDREGEAISWHLSEVLNLKNKDTKRIVFHEITQDAIKRAIENSRDIDINLVNAQQARRILDRLVGFSLSPVLWKKIKSKLSAGRVQSVAVRLIVEREREITEFSSKSEYKVTAYFNINGNTLKAEHNKKFKTKEEAESFLEKCKMQDFFIEDIVKKPGKKSPAPPFITSTLQQEASRKLGFSVTQTMKLAQSLYENGHITYMRTDSLNLSQLAIDTIKTTIIDNFGEKYSKTRKYDSKVKGAQEAHEAIRPTYSEHDKIEGTKQEQKLYELIWKRALASQMADVQIEKTIISISNDKKDISFNATGEVITFDGFLKLYMESNDDEQNEETQSLLPAVEKNEKAEVKKIEAQEKYDQAPYRYTEASLVKKMEELGIGRPSTYAPIISTIQQREYVMKESKPAKTRTVNYMVLENNKIVSKTISEKYGLESNKLFPTSIGIVVTDYLVEHFVDILDYNFTAQIEEKFDDIALGELIWNEMLGEFYGDFKGKVETALQDTDSKSMKWNRILGNDPATGLPVMIRVGRYGPYATIGEDDDFVRHSSLRKNQNIETVTLEEVLDLFRLPRNIGEYENDEVIVSIGKFGPYVKNNNAYFSLKKQDDPYTISLPRAIELIEEKKSKTGEKFSRTFEDIPGLEILKGRYGPYISYEKKNYKIPKEYDPETITSTESMEIIKEKNKNSK